MNKLLTICFCLFLFSCKEETLPFKAELEVGDDEIIIENKEDNFHGFDHPK
jgi:hypothetical protein